MELSLGLVQAVNMEDEDQDESSDMSTTWFIAKEYLKRLEVNFEEHGRKTFSLYPYGPTETREIEVFPGTHWITLTTRLYDLSSIHKKRRASVYEQLLKTNASLVEITFGIDKKNFIIIRNAIPVSGISYDVFNTTYEAHLSGIKLFHGKLKGSLNLKG
ncbi:MAG: hypothetical protein ACXADS_12210 [Candidatus Thorarchaeota archaeon]